MKSNPKKDKPDLKKFPASIVIRFKRTRVPYGEEEEIQKYLKKNNIISWNQLLQKFPGIVMRKLFTSLSPGDIVNLVDEAKKINSKYTPPNFFSCFVIDCPYGTNTEKLLSMLLSNKNVEDAYIESEPVPPACNFTGTNHDIINQGYLNPAPEGINAKFAWTVNGGCGNGSVKFIDIELGWNLEHEDIVDSGVRLLWGNEDPDFKYHGTAVLGIILMQDNNKGGLGITPKISANVIAQLSDSGRNVINDAIMKAIDNLGAGDILLLEAQITERNSPRKHWPVEVKSMTFDVIELATTRGIIVIEAAGNGSLFENRGNDLGDFVNSRNKRVLDTTSDDFKDSGAIIVAAASNSDAHGRTQSSNYGDRIDCFAWGEDVFTAWETNTAYEPDFNGTSSASAIIAGAAIAIQSIVEAAGKPRLTPAQMREVLSNDSSGTPSRNRIGVMPDLKKIIQDILS